MSASRPPLLEDATATLATFCAELEYGHIPAPAIERIKTSLLDSIGCCLYGATLPWTRRVQDLVLDEGATPVASLLGRGKKTSVSQAVLANSTAGHAFELDDIHKESIVHAGSIAAPVALAFAESRSTMTGRDVIVAMTAGYEIGTRVGAAATLSLFFRGFHPQGTSGVFVATATAARAINLDSKQTQHALGIAGSQAGGLMAAQEGAMVKRFHSGRAAQSGVYATLLAAKGFTGITDVLEAPYGGYLSTYSDKPAPHRLTEGLGTTWETLAVGYKAHASVTSIHTALDGLASIMRNHALSATDIEKIKVGLSTMTHVHCAWRYEAQGVTAAQMNLYYGLAVVAIDGAAFVEQFVEARLRDPAILDFIRRIEAHVDPDIDAMGPAFRHASVMEVVTRDGRSFRQRTLNRRGSPEVPLSVDEIRHKFREITKPCLSRALAEEMIELVAELEDPRSLPRLLTLLAATGSTLQSS